MNRDLTRPLVLARLASLILLAAMLIGLGFAVFPRFRSNLQALGLASILSGRAQGWLQDGWWTSPCNPQLSKNPAATPDSPAAGSLLPAIADLVAGDCDRAAHYLEQQLSLQAGNPNPIAGLMLAYTYAMDGRWQEAAHAFPESSITLLDDRRTRPYWSEVYYRAGADVAEGTATEPERQDALEWLRASDRVARVQPLVGNLALAAFWHAKGDAATAFEELRRALSTVDLQADATGVEAPAQAFERYAQARLAYLDAQAARYPQDAKWRNLAARYQRRTQVPGIRELSDRITPLYPVDYVWNEHWRLLGLNVDQDDLALGPLVEVVLYWCHEPNATESRCFAENRTVTNLAPDASFEWNEPASGVRPFGFTSLHDNSWPYAFKVVQEQGAQFFCLDNPEAAASGIQGPWHEHVPETAPVVVAADFRTAAGGSATLGVQSYISATALSDVGNVLVNATTADWERVAGVVTPPAGTDQLAIRLAKRKTVGQACFDNLLLFSLGGPPAELVAKLP
jgi:hypothetical protein